MTTTTIPATVYLNQATGSTLGFNRYAPARLHAALQFDMPVPQDTRPTKTAVQAALESIFEQLNIDDPTENWALQYRLVGHRSLSVGDVVRIGETAWAVASRGWQPVPTHELAAALAD
ncbi:hypothetical protein [Mycolicibacterium mageritense]|uniref:hypothetical protein n=1 Tax=Mycolicibacterium mageritense TaxID=53462 RepID=UPI0011D880C7|nr:hypothetical protein [Mycolicibacterium mageritense]TXI56470.1 MAG: hypothetical protein E6Q55_28810 [Mycolicibacterium mageritense]